MSVLTRTSALIGAGTLVALPLTLVAAPAQADVERHGACGNGRYELSVDREAGRWEVSVDIDGVRAGSKWKVVLRHDGDRFAKRTVRADREGDVDFERFHRNTAGSDTFKFRASRVNGATSCSGTVTVR
jgi:hypothetical protein